MVSITIRSSLVFVLHLLLFTNGIQSEKDVRVDKHKDVKRSMNSTFEDTAPVLLFLNSTSITIQMHSTCHLKYSKVEPGWTFRYIYVYVQELPARSAVGIGCEIPLYNDTVTCNAVYPGKFLIGVETYCTSPQNDDLDRGQPNEFIFDAPGGYNMEYIHKTSGTFDFVQGDSKISFRVPSGSLPIGAEGIVFSSDKKNLRKEPVTGEFNPLTDLGFLISAFNSTGHFGGRLLNTIYVTINISSYSYINETKYPEALGLYYYSDDLPYSQQSICSSASIQAVNQSSHLFSFPICHFSEFYPAYNAVYVYPSTSEAQTTYSTFESFTSQKSAGDLGSNSSFPVVAVSVGVGVGVLLIIGIITLLVFLKKRRIRRTVDGRNEDAEMEDISSRSNDLHVREEAPQFNEAEVYTKKATPPPETVDHNPYSPSAPPMDSDIS
eukprot:TRINITY_DN5511_c0_g3_i1.p1 TRINITY_DN5511_c0_g3~~TRINITY_DN5511_c0_g3_i1.p1  ORF type:complete len:436 (+),score=68.80 TRINITY_DN5511_c0_g3_i1:1-1308(+)